MNRSNFGAVRLPLLGAAVLASFAVSLSAQVVEKGRTYADLVATHPCNSGSSGRLARITDAQSSSSIGGGGGSTQVWAVCDGVSTWTLTTIGSAGGGSATAVTGSATLPATCTEKDLYQDTDSGGTEFYVCTATNTWTKASAFDQTSAGTISGVTQLNADNLRLDGNTISSTDTNGNINLTPNGTGQVLFNSGTAGVPAFRIGSAAKGIYYDPNSPAGIAFTDSTATLKIVQGEAILVGNGLLSWGNQVNDFASSTADISLRRAATGVLKVDSGSGTQKWLFQAGHRALAADFTSTSATPANLTGLTETLLTGRKYIFRMALRFSDSTAADGARFDFDGGTATATDFGVNCQVYDTALLLSTDTTALATDIVATTTTGASSIKCDGSFTVNAAGTFIPRAAQEAASGGTLTVELGSYIDITDASFN